MQELQSPRRSPVMRNLTPIKLATQPEHSEPFSPEEWAKLQGEDRWLATVMGSMALGVLGAALAVFGTIAVLAGLGWL